MKDRLQAIASQFPEIDTIVLGSGHSNIVGHLPMDKIPLLAIDEKFNKEPLENVSLGLFDSSSPNYTTYYPDVKPEDLAPKDEDFIYPVFRMLSNVIVHKRYNPIEFPEDVLRQSMGLLVGQTINVDHETALGNAIGSIVEVSWQKSYKTESGIVVPAGINARLKIDGKSNPRLVRGITMSPPSIHSNSVTVRFQWKPSHDFEDVSEFWNLLGTFDKDGNLIRRIATKITAYAETSLVNHGADPFAKLIGPDGKIVNPEMANSFYSFKMGETEKHQSKFFQISYKDNLVDGVFDEIKNSIQEDEENSTTPKNVNNKQTNKSNMKEKLLKLCLIMGITDEATLTEENFVEKVGEKINSLTNDASSAATLQAKVTSLETEVATLKGEKENLTKEAGAGAKALKDARDEALKAYKLVKGDKADEAMLKVLAEATYEQAVTFRTQYEKDAEDSFKLTCGDCHSTNVSRKSSASNKGDEGDGDEGKKTIKTSAEVANSILEKKGKFKASFIEEENKK